MDFVPLRREIAAPDAATEGVRTVTMHDGSEVRFRAVPDGYDPTDRDAAYAFVRAHQQRGEVVTGLLHVSEGVPEMHALNRTVEAPLAELAYERLCPGSAELDALMNEYR